MSYNTIAIMAKDEYLKARITACAAEQDVPNVEWWVDQNIWYVVASPGWAASYESALAALRPIPGYDPAVITDGAILATVQATLVAQEA